MTELSWKNEVSMKKKVKLPDKDGLDAFQSTWNENKNTINKHEMIEASLKNHLRFDEIQ